MTRKQRQNTTKAPKVTTVAPELTEEELGKVSGGAFNGFVNFGDIKGESTDKDHKDWIT